MDSDFLICLLVLQLLGLNRQLDTSSTRFQTSSQMFGVQKLGMQCLIFGSPVDGGQSLKMVSASYGCTSFIGRFQWVIQFCTGNLQMLRVMQKRRGMGEEKECYEKDCDTRDKEYSFRVWLLLASPVL